jgi:hypothetical protein
MAEKLTIYLEPSLEEMDTIYVTFNNRTFEVAGYDRTGILESVVSAALRRCLDIVPKAEKVPF